MRTFDPDHNLPSVKRERKMSLHTNIGQYIGSRVISSVNIDMTCMQGVAKFGGLIIY